MRILVCGGRDYTDRDKVYEVLDTLYEEFMPSFDGIIEGGAKGADSFAKKWAIDYNLTLWSFPADWKQYGKAAGAIRNQQMLDEGKPNLVVAFPGGKGTADMVRRALKAGIGVIEVGKA
jgi:YspA, cpYpsA-related SLOG family